MAAPVSHLIFQRARQCACVCLLAASTLVCAESLRDPTRPPARFDVGQQLSGPVASGPVLQSVLLAPGRKVAVISGQTVEVGAKVGDARVTEISETEVILRSGNATQILKLFPDVQKRVTPSSQRPRVEIRR